MMCQAKHHMGGVHYGYTVFCLAYRRHFSRQHPLYDFFKFHCEGTTPHISLSHQVLMLPGQFSDGFTSWGSNGYLKLAEKTFNERIYGDYDYHVIIKVCVLPAITISHFFTVWKSWTLWSYAKIRLILIMNTELRDLDEFSKIIWKSLYMQLYTGRPRKIVLRLEGNSYWVVNIDDVTLSADYFYFTVNWILK